MREYLEIRRVTLERSEESRGGVLVIYPHSEIIRHHIVAHPE